MNIANHKVLEAPTVINTRKSLQPILHVQNPLNFMDGKYFTDIPLVYWRAGDQYNRLLEIGFSPKDGALCRFTLVCFDSVSDYLPVANEVRTIVGLPICDLTPWIAQEPASPHKIVQSIQDLEWAQMGLVSEMDFAVSYVDNVLHIALLPARTTELSYRVHLETPKHSSIDFGVDLEQQLTGITVGNLNLTGVLDSLVS
jgi:hypothetical protein